MQLESRQNKQRSKTTHICYPQVQHPLSLTCAAFVVMVTFIVRKQFKSDRYIEVGETIARREHQNDTTNACNLRKRT